uniref:Uncharacterized protein n=1 Tax=Oryza glumipatula TaxID=40148 RepID=A0A0E0ABH4_9ORYZ
MASGGATEGAAAVTLPSPLPEPMAGWEEAGGGGSINTGSDSGSFTIPSRPRSSLQVHALGNGGSL